MDTPHSKGTSIYTHKCTDSQASLVLERILRKQKLLINDLEKPCSKEAFQNVANEMGPFDQTAMALIKETKREEIKANYPNDEKMRKIRLLEVWKRSQGFDATYLALVEAFLKIDDRQAAECIVAFVKQLKYASLPDQGTVYPGAGETEENLFLTYEEVTQKYASCVTKITRSFVQRGLNAAEARIFLISKAFYLAEEIRSDDNLEAVLFILMRHCSWFNHNLLESFLTEFGDEDEKKAIKDYKNHTLMPYLTRSILKIPSMSFGSEASSDDNTMLANYKVHDQLSGNDVKKNKGHICQLLSIILTRIKRLYNWKHSAHLCHS